MAISATTEYPNVWPQAGLFAFSGADGETRHWEPFVASGDEATVGWRFWIQPRLTLRAALGTVPVVASAEPDGMIFCDCWRLRGSADGHTCHVSGAFLDCHAVHLRIAAERLPAGILPGLAADREGVVQGNNMVFAAEGCWLAVSASTPGLKRDFGIAISYRSEAEALQRAENARKTNLERAIRKRLRFFESVQTPRALDSKYRRAFYKAVSIQKVNMESAQADIPCRWTTPDRMPHRHMWLWDTAFHAVGLSRIRADLAEDALRALLAKQHGDGELSLAAAPGRPPERRNESQPPIVVWAARLVFERSGNAAFIEEIYSRLVRYLEWFESHRAVAGGLYGWQVRVKDDAVCAARGGESGMDNSPRFDTVEHITAVDLSSYMAAEYHHLGEMAAKLAKKEEAAQWRARHQRIVAAVNEALWDEESGFYYDLDEHGAFVKIKTLAGLAPFHAKAPGARRAQALMRHVMDPESFWTPLQLPSVARNEATFSKDMWRGPAWINVNLLLSYAIRAYGYETEAQQLAVRSLEEVTRWYEMLGCFYEYYDALAETPPPELPRKGAPGAAGGVGFGVVPDLQWTAAAFVDFAHSIASD